MSHSADVRIWFDDTHGKRYRVNGVGPEWFYCDDPPPVGTEGVLTMTVDGSPDHWRLRVAAVIGTEVRTEDV